MTTKRNSLMQGKKDKIFPVAMGEDGDIMWVPELEM